MPTLKCTKCNQDSKVGFITAYKSSGTTGTRFGLGKALKVFPIWPFVLSLISICPHCKEKTKLLVVATKKIKIITILAIIIILILLSLFFLRNTGARFQLNYGGGGAIYAYTIQDNLMTHRTSSEPLGGKICEITFTLTNNEKEQLIKTITDSNFFNLKSGSSSMVSGSGPANLSIAYNGKSHLVDEQTTEGARVIIYKLEEIASSHEQLLKEKCLTAFIPKYSYCHINLGADDVRVRKVGETWEENGKNCICQSYENIVCKPLMQSSVSAILISECSDKSYITKKADYIIEGTIETVESSWNAGKTSIFTNSVFKIEKYVKGTPLTENNLQIVTDGGTVGEITQQDEDQPIFYKSERARIYFQKTNGEFSVVCGRQGVEEL